jgi:ribonuclease HII
MKLIAGLDEAGRGPAIGPMVIAGVAIREGREPELLSIGVKDSKKLSAKRRDELLPQIMARVENYHVEVLDAEVIDSLRSERNLNQIEADAMAKIIDRLWPDIAQIGSVDVDPARFGAEILRRMVAKPEVFSVHHAEDRFPAVAAASILAKTARDRMVGELKLSGETLGQVIPEIRRRGGS